MESANHGQVCHGIAYLDGGALGQRRTSSPLVQCFGRLRQFQLPHPMELPDQSSSSSSKYLLRSSGSTAVLFSQPDPYGRTRTVVAHAVGAMVEVGPAEQGVVDWSIRLRNEGAEKVILAPVKSLFDRSILVANRTFSMLRDVVVPVKPFVRKWAARVPQVASEAYEIATSIRVEIEVIDRK